MKPPCCQDKPSPSKKLDLFDPDELTTPSCCSGKKETPQQSPPPENGGGCCGSSSGFNWMLWGSMSLVLLSYIAHLFFHEHLHSIPRLSIFTHGVYEMMNKMWLGLFAGVLVVGLLSHVSKTFVQSLLGKGGSMKGIFRATAAGLLLDLCNHGILLVAMQLHKRGASLGQTYAFLIASPWNSLSMTLILWGLIGWKWTLTFILTSAVIGIITGYITDKLIPPVDEDLDLNPVSNKKEKIPSASVWQQAKDGFRATKFDLPFFTNSLANGWRDSKSIMKWIFIGALLAPTIRAVMPPEAFATWFGPSIVGISLTLAAASVIEVCSEGSSPLAADLVTRAQAPGNGFTFLMAGAATDYTEIMALKETTGKWKLAFLLPLLTLPQVIAISLVMNQLAG